jgi:hypothetical protein
MKVPEKIYLNSYGSGFSHGFSSKKQHNNDIEYIRSDTFIEKACEMFCKIRCNGKPPRSTCTSLGTCCEHDNFRKSLKEE